MIVKNLNYSMKFLREFLSRKLTFWDEFGCVVRDLQIVNDDIFWEGFNKRLRI